MRIVVVEDNQDFLADLVPALSALPGAPEVKAAASRNVALVLIEQEFFDLIVLDLTIPQSTGLLMRLSNTGMRFSRKVRR